MASEIDEEINTENEDSAKTEAIDDQVEQRMQRLNLYFEKENVSILRLFFLKLQSQIHIHIHFEWHSSVWP